MRLRSLAFPLLAMLSACEPKEAADPADILAEDPSFLHGPEHGLLAEETTETREEEPWRAATFAECQRAHRHLEALGFDLQIQQEPDPAAKARLTEDKERLLDSPAVRKRITRGAEDCVARGTSAEEADCVAQVQAEAGIDACVK